MYLRVCIVCEGIQFICEGNVNTSAPCNKNKCVLVCQNIYQTQVNMHNFLYAYNNKTWKLATLASVRVCVNLTVCVCVCVCIISFCCLSLLLRSHLELRLSFLSASWHFFPLHCLSGFHHLFSISVSLSLSLSLSVFSQPSSHPLFSPLLYLVTALHNLLPVNQWVLFFYVQWVECLSWKWIHSCPWKTDDLLAKLCSILNTAEITCQCCFDYAACMSFSLNSGNILANYKNSFCCSKWW